MADSVPKRSVPNRRRGIGNEDAWADKGKHVLTYCYYDNDAVRARMVEFLGGTFLDQASCAYIVGCGGEEKSADAPLPPSELPRLLSMACDVSRSLWDRRSLIAHLDIEYVNFEYPGEAYLHPHRAFAAQRPVVHAIQQQLLRFGISPLHLLTGRGHHFVWAIDRDSKAFQRLAETGYVPETLQQRYDQPHPPFQQRIAPELGRAFAGLGCVMEYLGHCVKRQAAMRSNIPIQLTDVEVGDAGNGAVGREAISIDISEYADPLHTRYIRVPFSLYLKPQRNRDSLGPRLVDETPTIHQIPAFELTDLEAIDVMRNADLVTELAERAGVCIPDQTAGTEVLLNEYNSSALGRFHDWFYSEHHHLPDHWPGTYDQLSLDSLPCCAARILQQPNDLLLKPAGIQHVVRVLLALGWHPRHIAGLIRSKYERDYGWGSRWYHRDAANRADWYTRLFAGQVATELDTLVDFNCVSNREKGYCFEPECGHNLADYRDGLWRRKNHERLGCRPFDRLLLSNEHL